MCLLKIQFYYRDNYGFVTFKNRDEAYQAVENGNEDPSLPHYDLCFGGRRAFCKVQYSDLGKQMEAEFDIFIVIIYFFIYNYISCYCCLLGGGPFVLSLHVFNAFWAHLFCVVLLTKTSFRCRCPERVIHGWIDGKRWGARGLWLALARSHEEKDAMTLGFYSIYFCSICV